jgi:uncharacterized protein with von Willebrand factor type A (vWA) domain
MFVEFFYYLKERLPISITEYMTLIEALDKGLIHNMVEFYYVGRSILCKNEHQFDVFDISFANFFKDSMITFPEDIKNEIWDWLNKEITLQELLEGIKILIQQYADYINIEDLQEFLEELLKKEGVALEGKLRIDDPDKIKDEIWDWLKKTLAQGDIEFQEMISQNFDLEEMQRQFEELMQQQTEEHNGGHHWIGTQGQSPFGNMGQNPMGMRLGGSSGMRMAVQIAQKRIGYASNQSRVKPTEKTGGNWQTR